MDLKLLQLMKVTALLLFPLDTSSRCVKMKDQHLHPYAVSAVLKVVEYPDEGILPLGFNITISCTSNRSKSYPGYRGQPYWIQMYRNDRLLHDCGGRSGAVDSEDFKECQFVIVNATSHNSGIYDCWSLNQVSCTESSKISLTFRAPSPPKITNTPPREVYAASGSLVNLTCKATGVPLPVVTWFKDGILMPKEKLTGEKADSQITFPAVTSTDQGNYSCEARNAVGWERSSGTSLFLAQRPSITFHPKNIRVYKEEKLFIASFTCKATGNPEPVITWLKNNSTKANGTSVLAGSISILILALHGGEKTLGNYSCVAKNLAGQAYSKEGTLEILPASLLSPNFGDSSSLSSSCKLWISVAVVAPFLLFGFGIATIYVYNRSKKAELYFNKQAYEVQDLSFQGIHQTSTSQRGQQLAKETELTATTLKKTQMGVENEAYTQNPF
ncbi:peroxidasin homolog isoform X1 [Acropora millepora]|uniref:peroxidasin homolog isoform X1 n=1 Tax=Acropora millepora TaxID=45264 RepID=UPI001CF285BB|nr:peroxidasin homolog isoform X1 [Acropora millepora]XP_044184087.1 peroxidasin homolog isoform X1 [Acropora millepora]